MTAYELEINALRERIEALEKRRAIQEANSKDVEEYARQDRWHATRDAVLPECMRYWDRRDDVDVDVSEEAHQLAVQMADRAHGPLEASAARELDAKIRKHVASEIEKEDANVGALVKAAQCLLGVIGDYCPAYVADLRAAIQPFEAAK